MKKHEQNENFRLRMQKPMSDLYLIYKIQNTNYKIQNTNYKIQNTTMVMMHDNNTTQHNNLN